MAAEDYLGALDILQSAKATVKNELGNLQSLKHVGRQLKEYEGLVSDLLSTRFVTLAVTIPVDTGSAGAAAVDVRGSDQSWQAAPESLGDGVGSSGGGGGEGVAVAAAAAAGSNGAGGGELRRGLELTVQGLLRLGEMERVVGVVQERVSEDLKLIIR